MKFQTPYKRDTFKGTEFKDKHLTEQAHKDTTDINRILKDYQKTGFVAHAKQHEGQYDDVSSMDFQKAMQTVATVKTMFEGLPSSYRAQFGNPSNFLDFVQNPNNEAQLAKMGILRGNDGIDIHGAATKAPVEAVQAAQPPTEADKGAPALETQPEA